MSDEISELSAKIERMDRELQHVRDRQEILDVLMRHARMVDRHDWSLIAEVYGPDAVSDHGSFFLGRSKDFPDWAGPALEKSAATHNHTILNHMCEITGAVAHAETYAIVFTLSKDEKAVGALGIRYVDRFEKRDGKWRIALRRVIGEWRASMSGKSTGTEYPAGKWDKTDMSYMRPLRLLPEQERELADRT